MATKANCPTLKKVAENEPIFVLRAQDITAPETVLHWVKLNTGSSAMPQAKLDEARACAEKMRAWHTRKMPD